MGTDEIGKIDSEAHNYKALSKRVNEIFKKVCRLSNVNGVDDIKVENPPSTTIKRDINSNTKDLSEKLKLVEFIKKSEQNKLNYLKSQVKLSEELIEKATEVGSKFVKPRDSVVSVTNQDSTNNVSLDQLNEMERELERSLLGITEKNRTMIPSSSSSNGQLTNLNGEMGHIGYSRSTQNFQNKLNAVNPQIQVHGSVYSTPLLEELDPWLSPHSNSERQRMMKDLTPEQVAELFAGETGVPLGPPPTTFLQHYVPAGTSSQQTRHRIPANTNYNINNTSNAGIDVPVTKYSNVAGNWSNHVNQNYSASGIFRASAKANMGTFGVNHQPIRKYQAHDNNLTLLSRPQNFRNFPTQSSANLLGNSQKYLRYPQQNNISYGAQLQQFGQLPNGQYPAQTFGSNWNNNNQNGYGGNDTNYTSNVPIGNNYQKTNNVQVFNSVTSLNNTNITINEFTSRKRKRSNGIVIANDTNENHRPTQNNESTNHQITDGNNPAGSKSEPLAWDGFALAKNLNNMGFHQLI